jgi:hypothetical protein
MEVSQGQKWGCSAKEKNMYMDGRFSIQFRLSLTFLFIKAIFDVCLSVPT